LLYMGFHQRRVVVDFVELYLLRFAQAAKPEQAHPEAQAQQDAGLLLLLLTRESQEHLYLCAPYNSAFLTNAAHGGLI